MGRGLREIVRRGHPHPCPSPIKGGRVVFLELQAVKSPPPPNPSSRGSSPGPMVRPPRLRSPLYRPCGGQMGPGNKSREDGG